MAEKKKLTNREIIENIGIDGGDTTNLRRRKNTQIDARRCWI